MQRQIIVIPWLLFFFKQKTAYEIGVRLVGSEMCIRDSLIIQQPDLGAMVVIVAEIMGVLFLGGLSFKIFTFVISVVVGFVFWMIIDTPWRLGRIFAYLSLIHI